MARLRAGGVVLAVVALALTSAAEAFGGSAGDQAAAEALFDQGKALMAKGRFADACPKFRESNRLDQGIGTSLWLAQCYEKNGQTASAWAMFREAAAMAAKNRDPREKIARTRAHALDDKLANLVLVVPPSAQLPDLHVSRDGTDVGGVLWNTPVPTDPGPHSILVTAEGHEPQTLTIYVLPGPREQSITIPVLAVLSSPPVEAAERPKETVPQTAAAGSSPLRIAGITVGAAGLIVAGVAAYFGVHAKSELDSSNQPGVCGLGGQPNHCSYAGVSDRSAAISAAQSSTIAFVVSAVAVAGGVVLYVTAPAPRHVATAVRAAPWWWGQARGVVLEAEF